MHKMLNEVLIALGPEGARRTDPVTHEDVKRWSSTDDIETLGALCHLLDIAEFRNRIQPPLSFDEHQTLFLRYSERCLVENPKGEWADSRYQAGWNLVGWFKVLWRDKTVPRQKLLEIKRLLGRLYKVGDSTLQVCIVNATLEHLFEDRSIATYFKDWKKDPLLAQAYADAMLWPKKGGTSPLTGQHDDYN